MIRRDALRKATIQCSWKESAIISRYKKRWSWWKFLWWKVLDVNFVYGDVYTWVGWDWSDFNLQWVRESKRILERSGASRTKLKRTRKRREYTLHKYDKRKQDKINKEITINYSASKRNEQRTRKETLIKGKSEENERKTLGKGKPEEPNKIKNI